MNAALPGGGDIWPGAGHLAPPSRVRDRVPWLLGFFCFLVPALPTISVLPGPLKSNGSPARLVAILFFGLVVLGFLVVRRIDGRRGVNPGALLIVLYCLVEFLIYGVGILHFDGTFVEAGKARAAISTIANAGVALYILSRIKTVRQRSILLGFLVSGLAFACLVGVLQGSTGTDLRFAFQPPGFVLNREAAGLAERGGSLRVVGTSHHAIEFSVLAATAVPLSLHLARFSANLRLRRLATVACVLALVAVPAAVSRSGLVSLIACLLVYMFAFNLRQIGKGIAISVMVFLAYVIALPGAANALWVTIVNSQTDDSVLTRVGDYAVVSQTFHESPWFGLGLGASDPTVYRFLDNEWLQAIVQGGVVGLGAMILLTAGGMAGMVAGLREARTGRDRDQVYAMGAALIGITASSFTFDLFAYQQVTFTYFILFGLLWSCSHVVVDETGPASVGTGDESIWALQRKAFHSQR